MSDYDDEFRRIIGEEDDVPEQLLEHRRALTDAVDLFDAITFQSSLQAQRAAIAAMSEADAKRALLAGAIGRHSGAVSPEEHDAWLSRDHLPGSPGVAQLAEMFNFD